MKNIFTLIVVLILAQVSCQVTSSGCENGVVYTFLDKSETFDDAILSCQAQNSTLAILPDLATTEAANDFLTRIDVGAAWIGLRREETGGALTDVDPTEPSAFNFIDGTPFVDDFASIRGVSPWRQERPNNDNGNEACVRIIAGSQEWDDLPCTDGRSVLCTAPCDDEVTSIPAVTPSPTKEMTPTSDEISPTSDKILPTSSPSQDSSVPESQQPEDQLTALVAVLGVIIAAFAVIILVFTVVIFSKKRQQQREKNLFDSYSTMVTSFKVSTLDRDGVY